MDNYFEKDDAIKFADPALKKNPESYTFQIIAAIINAQKAIDSDLCKVYKLTDDVRKNAALNVYLMEEAIKIIFECLDLYECMQ